MKKTGIVFSIGSFCYGRSVCSFGFSNINKGAVKAAKFRISQSEIQEKDIEQQIQAEIMQAWFNYQAEKKKVVQFKSGMLGDAQK